MISARACSCVLGQSAFNGVTGITSLVIDNAATAIGASVFRDCSSLASVDLGTQVTTFGNYAFKGTAIAGPLTIPTTVTEIGFVRQAPSLAPLSRLAPHARCGASHHLGLGARPSLSGGRAANACVIAPRALHDDTPATRAPPKEPTRCCSLP